VNLVLGAHLPATREPKSSRDTLPLASQLHTRLGEPQRTKSAHLHSLLASRLFVSLLFGSTLLATLTAGLWPFRPPENDATGLKGDDAIWFSGQGTAISDGMLRFGDAGGSTCTLELWLKPASAWIGGTPLSFYNRERGREFAISQDGAELLLRLVDWDRRGTNREQVLVVQNVFRRSEFLLTLTSNGANTLVYVDGQMMLNAPHFQLSSKDLAARLILGSAPRRDDAWAGEVKGLAIYAADLSAGEVMKHSRQWIATGRPTVSVGQDPVALYLFRGPWDKVVPNAVAGGVDLTLPRRFRTVDQLRFQSGASEKRFDNTSRNDAVLNVLGFVPLGWVAAWFWMVLVRGKSFVPAAVMTGIAASFVIEFFQSYLPTRYSGTTDLITNSIGTCFGVAAYLAAAWMIAKKNRVGHSGTQPV
jgi:VanZ family protein